VDTKHLATKCNHYSRLLNYKYCQCSWRQGELALSIHVDSVLEQMPGSVQLFFIHLLRKPMKRLFAALWW